MGKIIETAYHDTVEKITGFNGKLLDNSFYVLNDKKPTIVTYYNINKEASSLDPGSKLAYDNVGRETPLRFNKIDRFIVYGFDKIELQTDNDEYGLEADKITGDCFVLPNTIIPIYGDYFEVEHITDSTWLFIVTDVQQDTLQNGSNAYKLTYRLEYIDNKIIQENVVEHFTMVEKREGTNIVKVVETDKLARAKELDRCAVTLKEYFIDLFYNQHVQTFIYCDLTEWRVYDPYMIEFLIRNKILDNGSDSFIYVNHQIPVVNTFSMDYDRTFFRAFEDKDLDKLLKSEYTTMLEDITAYGSTFAARYEAYFKAKYIKPRVGYRTESIPSKLLYRICDKKYVDEVTSNVEHIPLFINVLIKYFTEEDITNIELESIYNYHYNTAIHTFYIIPLLILSLEDAIERLMR